MNTRIIFINRSLEKFVVARFSDLLSGFSQSPNTLIGSCIWISSGILPMRSSETTGVGSGIKLTSYEPASRGMNTVLPDQKIDGVRFSQSERCGADRRIARAVGPVGRYRLRRFLPGASRLSAFTWTHLNEQQKGDIIERLRQGLLRMLKEAVEMYGGKFILPFAGHFSLWHPSHEGYVRAMKKNTADDVVEAFEGTPTRSHRSVAW